MPQSVTILCPKDEPQAVVAVLRDLIRDTADIRVTGNESEWSTIEVKTSTAALTLNRKVQVTRGDSFSKMLLGMLTYFGGVNTSATAIKKTVIERTENTTLAIGVVAEPEFVEGARHFDCIFGVAAALNAIIWTGSGVINAEGQLLLDGEGNSEVA